MKWVCKRCPELPPFKAEAELKEHQKSHLTSFRCPRPWCSTIKRNAKKLDEHVKVCRMPNTPITCSVQKCASIFRTLRGCDSYKRHLIKVNKKTLVEAKAMIDAERPKPENSDSETDFEDPDDAASDPKKFKMDSPTDEYKIPKPVNEKDRKLLKYGRLTILYGNGIRGLRVAHIRLTKENLTPSFPKPSLGEGVMDKNLDEMAQATRADFVSSVNGQVIQKGHLQSVFFMREDQAATDATKLWSVMLPQIKEFNKDAWLTLEEYETWLLKHRYEVIDSFTGGLYVNDLGKSNRLPLVSHFFMLLICHVPGGQIDVEIFVLEHKEHQPGVGINTFYKTYDELLAMDRDNFVPRFNLKNIRKMNGVEMKEKSARAPDAESSVDDSVVCLD